AARARRPPPPAAAPARTRGVPAFWSRTAQPRRRGGTAHRSLPHRERPGVETGPVAGVARPVGLVHLHEQCVAVAVQRHRDDTLHMAGGLTLDPVLLAAAGPVGAAAGGERAVQRL